MFEIAEKDCSLIGSSGDDIVIVAGVPLVEAVRTNDNAHPYNLI